MPLSSHFDSTCTSQPAAFDGDVDAQAQVFFEAKNTADDFDKAAEDLRLATRHLGMIVGKVDVEEILGSIFNDFCIGK